MLIIFGGLPGVGKTMISRKIAQAIGAVYLRIDTIETAIMVSHLNLKEVNDAGYRVAYGLAKDNLAMGHTVVADSVNPISLTRDAWREVAHCVSKDFIEIEVTCSDIKEHQKRVETRVADIEGHVIPTWEKVLDRQYDIWEPQDMRIDTATHSLDQSVNEILNFLSKHKIFSKP